MRILHLYKDYPPILGGIENHVRLLAEGQVRRGHDVTVLVTNPAGRATLAGVEAGVRVVRAGRLATVASTPLSPALAGQLLAQDPDVVHLHFPYPVGEVSQWLLRRGKATVLTYHSDVVRQAGILRLYRPLLRRILAGVDAIVIGSPPMAGSAYLAGLAGKLHLIPYGIPLERFAARPDAGELARVRERYLRDEGRGTKDEGTRKADLRSAAHRRSAGEEGRTEADEGPTLLPLCSPAPLLLFVGRLRYYKGLDVLIRALPQIPDARLAVVGTGPMAGEWQALARGAGVAERIAWLGEVGDEDLPALYHLADLFVLPASHPSEAFGLVQVEAMAAGLPVVCTELGTGTSYVNRDRVTGLVVPPRDPQALAAAIGELLADPGRRAAMGAAARERVTAEFGLETMVARVLELYAGLLHSRR